MGSLLTDLHNMLMTFYTKQEQTNALTQLQLALQHVLAHCPTTSTASATLLFETPTESQLQLLAALIRVGMHNDRLVAPYIGDPMDEIWHGFIAQPVAPGLLRIHDYNLGRMLKHINAELECIRRQLCQHHHIATTKFTWLSCTDPDYAQHKAILIFHLRVL